MQTFEQNSEIVRKPIPGNTPVKVEDTSIVPFCFVGLLGMIFPNGKEYYGTATLISEGEDNSRYLLTCAHNLYDIEDGGEATKVTFQLGYSFPVSPHGTFEAEKFFYPEDYKKVAISRNANIRLLGDRLVRENINYDYGLIKLKNSISIVDIPQMVAETTDDLTNMPVQINGYGYYASIMSKATGKIAVVDENSLKYPISTDKGASGSSILSLDNRSIVGIHTRSTDEEFNQGVRITQSVKEQINKWMGQ
jgi:V8-like Glu-specific endopeptidase